MKTIKLFALAVALAFAATMAISPNATAASAASRSSPVAQQTQRPPMPQQAEPGAEGRQQTMPQQEQQQQTEPGAQQATPQQGQQEQEPGMANQQAQGEQAQAFTGKVVKRHGKYELYLPASRTSYKLSDQSQAKQFKGQTVTVQGTLNANSNTIEVTSIQPATASGQSGQ